MNINSSAKLPSDTCTKTTVINFSATIEGFQDQLLSITIHMVNIDNIIIMYELQQSIVT